MKKLAIFLLMVFCWTNLTIIVKGEEAESSLPDSKAYIVTENSTGTVLSEYNADERLAPASLTKIMLLLLIAEEVNAGRLSFDEQVKTSAHASSMEGSVIWLEPGETMSVSDLVKSVVISSANDSTVTLAEHIAGSEEEFVRLMNQKAHVLGMTNTNFINAVGYDHPDHYTTARDVATMSRALMRDENYELFSENMLTRLSSVRAGTEREAQLLNTNNMITYYKGIEGLKTGTTDNAGFCLSAAATRGEMRLISVVLGCKDNYDRVDLSEKLLDRGFAEYELYYPKSPEAPEIPQNTEMPDNPESMPSRFPPLFVQNGMEREVAIAEILPSVIVIPKGRAKDIEYEIYLPEKVTAPIAKNQPLGTVTATLDGEVIYESYVTAASDVRKLTFFSMLLAMFRSFFGIAIN